MKRIEVNPVGDREILISRDFDAPRDLVFDCWTKPHFVQQWLSGPDGWRFVSCEIDLREGGHYRYVWENQQGERMGLTGQLKEVVRPEKLVSSELFDEDWTDGEALVTAIFSEDDASRTRLTQTVRYSSSEARERALVSGMADGMEAGFARLDRMLTEMPKAS